MFDWSWKKPSYQDFELKEKRVMTQTFLSYDHGKIGGGSKCSKFSGHVE